MPLTSLIISMNTITLLKPLNNTSLLIPYEQFLIHALHKSGKLISEQNPGKPKPPLQMAINPSHPPTWPIQLSSNLHSAHFLQRRTTALQQATSNTTWYVGYSNLHPHPYTYPPPQSTTIITHPGNTQCTCTTPPSPPPNRLIHTPRYQAQYVWPDKMHEPVTILWHTQLYMATYIHQKAPTYQTAHYPKKRQHGYIHDSSCCSKKPHMQ